MASESSMIARQLRLQQWADDIRDCNARPSGMTVGQWCSEHGIKKAAYYWRLRTVREACLDTVRNAGNIPENGNVFSVSEKTDGIPAARAICGYTVPGSTIRYILSSSMITRRRGKRTIRGNF